MNALEELEELKIEWDSIVALRININEVSIIYEAFIDSIDELKEKLSKINYDDDYGCQYLFGYILMIDDSWYERYQYDGAEWWEHKVRPTKAEVLNYTKH